NTLSALLVSPVRVTLKTAGLGGTPTKGLISAASASVASMFTIIGEPSPDLTVTCTGLDHAVAPRLSVAFAVRVYSPEGTSFQMKRNESKNTLKFTTPSRRSPTKNSTPLIQAFAPWAMATISTPAGARNAVPSLGRTIP